MQPNQDTVRLWPTQASTLAWDVDLFYAAMIAVSLFFTVLIAGLVLYFAVKYRRREGDYRPPHVETSKALEALWTVIPVFIVAGMFFWGTELFFKQTFVPENAMNIDVTGKQWMFKFQHPNGRREINALHVPVGQPIRLTMASEDVIHDLFIPDFRIKKDLVPGRYMTTWFEATKTGEYHFFCNQYCGTQHSDMIGRVIVMQPTEYQNWLSGYTGQSPVEAGEALFTKHACNTCHSLDGSTARGPALAGLLGQKVQLADGTTVLADKNYIRESILKPQEKIVAGFTPIMPSFQGLLNEEEINNLIAYIETLNPGAGSQYAGQSAAAATGGQQQVQASDFATKQAGMNAVQEQPGQYPPAPASTGSGHGAAVVPPNAPLSGPADATQQGPAQPESRSTNAPEEVSTAPAVGATDAATTSSTAPQEVQ